MGLDCYSPALCSALATAGKCFFFLIKNISCTGSFTIFAGIYFPVEKFKVFLHIFGIGNFLV